MDSWSNHKTALILPVISCIVYVILVLWTLIFLTRATIDTICISVPQILRPSSPQCKACLTTIGAVLEALLPWNIYVLYIIALYRYLLLIAFFKIHTVFWFGVVTFPNWFGEFKNPPPAIDWSKNLCILTITSHF